VETEDSEVHAMATLGKFAAEYPGPEVLARTERPKRPMASGAEPASSRKYDWWSITQKRCWREPVQGVAGVQISGRQGRDSL
jgi:hypothetical protein